jgi:hypothetical protein
MTPLVDRSKGRRLRDEELRDAAVDHRNLGETSVLTPGEARPAYKRAFDVQLAIYTGKPPTG